MTDSVLVVAAHPDDEVLGCGGTIARMNIEGRSVHVLLLADGESSRDDFHDRGESKLYQARESAASAAGHVLGYKSLMIKQLPDNRLDGMELLDIVKIVEHYIDLFNPKTIFTHHSGDVNVDHRIVHEAVLAACRPQPDNCVKELLFFEVPSSTEWRPSNSGYQFQPNYFVDITDTLAMKINALNAYKAELRSFPHSRSVEGVEALAQWRGVTVGVNAAEAFELGRKIV